MRGEGKKGGMSRIPFFEGLTRRRRRQAIIGNCGDFPPLSLGGWVTAQAKGARSFQNHSKVNG